MNIIELRVDSFKRLRAVRIATDGKKLITISGRNSQGKSSILDAIAAAIGGLDHVPRVPVRAGQEQAKIFVDLGDLRVTRTINPDRTGTLVVENKDGSRRKTPQKVLDELAAQLTLDPMEFMNLKASERIEALKKLVPEFNFAGNAEARQKAYDRRREVGRDYARYKANLDMMPEQPEERPQAIDVADTLARLKAAQEHNRVVDETYDRWAKQDRDVEELAQEIAALRAEVARKADAFIKLQEMIDSREDTPTHVETASLQEAIAGAQEIDRKIEHWDRYAGLKDDADNAQAEVHRLDDLIVDLDDARNLAIRNAKLPVDGLGFGEEDVTIEGLPFEQASSSTQLTVATGITMALRPTLKVILVRQGPLLDVEHLELLARMAADRDYQLWIERVDPDAKTGIVIEDGEVVS